MANDNWDFSAYDFDLDSLKKADNSDASGQSVSVDEHQKPKAQEMEKVESMVPVQEEHPESEATSVTGYTVASPPEIDFMSDDSQPADDRIEEKLKKIKEKRGDRQKPEKRSFGKKETEQMAESMVGAMAIVCSWTEQLVSLRDNAQQRLPKGIRISIHRLHEIADVYRATQMVVRTFAEEDKPEVYRLMEDKKLSAISKQVVRKIQEDNKKVTNEIEGLAKAIESTDHEARTIARELKQKVIKFHSDAEQLANVLYETTFAYPHPHGQLALFAKIAEKEGDATCIDRAIKMAGQIVVQLADAAAMMKAIDEKDDKILEEILDRMINYQLSSEN